MHLNIDVLGLNAHSLQHSCLCSCLALPQNAAVAHAALNAAKLSLPQQAVINSPLIA